MYGRKGELAPCYGRCGELHPMYGKPCPEERKEKIRLGLKKKNDAYKVLYSTYKQHGGILKRNEFIRAIKSGDVTFEVMPLSLYTI